jgi:hypothetical protein
MDTTVTFKQEETSGHEPQPGLDTKTDRLTDRQSQCDRLDLSKGPNRVDVFPPSPEDRNRSSFRNVVFSSF